MLNISVITICYNNLHVTKATCASIEIQELPPFEHIIIDGSSNNEIKSYLESQRQPAYRKWICEPDKGIADAFNKGLALATGDVVVMLNSGDTLFDESVLEKVTDLFRKNPTISWMHGRYQLVRGNKQVIIGKPYEKAKLYRGMRSICHQTMFYRKHLHDRYGLYDVAEKIGMDYDFLCRIADEPFVFTEAVLINFAPAGTSSVNYLASLKDARRIYEKYYGRSFKLWLWQIRLRILHYLLKSPVGELLYSLKTKMKLENM